MAYVTPAAPPPPLEVKLKKYVPFHKQGDVCPNGFPAIVERGNNEDHLDSE